MDLQAKSPRQRVANFTADEKALLAQLIKKKPIIESKLTDGKSIAKKQAAWELITQEFNCNANVIKRQTITLKRAWDNMKSMARKTRAMERGNLIRTGGGPRQPPSSPQNGAIISMIEEAAPVMICEIQNSFDSDGTILSSIDNNDKIQVIETLTGDMYSNLQQVGMSDDVLQEEDKMQQENLKFYTSDDVTTAIDSVSKKNNNVQNLCQYQGRRPADYIRREAVLRIKYLENKNNLETQILKTQLETEEIKKRAALLEEERNKLLLEKTKLELNKLKQNN